MSTAVQSWVEHSRYDLDTASAMLKSGRYLYVLFCCQQAVEKAIKAVIVRRTEDFPPRLHNLLRLAKIADIKMEAGREDFLGDLLCHLRRALARAGQVLSIDRQRVGILRLRCLAEQEADKALDGSRGGVQEIAAALKSRVGFAVVTGKALYEVITLDDLGATCSGGAHLLPVLFGTAQEK